MKQIIFLILLFSVFAFASFNPTICLPGCIPYEDMFNIKEEVNETNITNDTIEEVIFEPSEEAVRAKQKIENSKVLVEQMKAQGFNTERVGDLILMAEQDYAAQYALEQLGGRSDYSTIYLRATEISNLKSLSFEVSDELVNLKNEIDKLDESLNKTSIEEKFKLAKQEFYDERYEQSQKLIDESYNDMSHIIAGENVLLALYDAATKTIGNFIDQNKYYIVSGTIAITVILYFFRNYLKRYWLKRRLNKIKLEKDVLKQLIQKTQKEYFDNKNIPETVFHIRMNKFADLIRDIDRQVPIIEEELYKTNEKIKGHKLKEEIKKEKQKN